jgi:hypothetical protein
MMEVQIPPKRRLLQGVTSQKTTFFIVTAVNTSTLTQMQDCHNWHGGSGTAKERGTEEERIVTNWWKIKWKIKRKESETEDN